MLVEFSVENGKRYLKTAVIYGANASGKSNLIRTINFMAEFVSKSHQMQIGTRKFFLLVLELLANINTDIVSFVDEMNINLHPLLSRYIIEIFNNAKINPYNNTQLILTTHDTIFLT